MSNTSIPSNGVAAGSEENKQDLDSTPSQFERRSAAVTAVGVGFLILALFFSGWRVAALLTAPGRQALLAPPAIYFTGAFFAASVLLPSPAWRPFFDGGAGRLGLALPRGC